MKELAILCTVLVFATGYAVSADNDKDEGKGKKVPPGLEKKGGVPPGQAKKRGQSDDTAPATTPAGANTPATPASPAAPASPVPAEAAKTSPTAAKVDAKNAAPKPATLAEQKTALDTHARTINQATKSNPSLQKVALQQISKETGVSVEQLQQQEKNHPEAGANALLLGNLIAKESNTKFGELMRARESGKHWADIAKAHNVDIDALVQKSSRVAQALRSQPAPTLRSLPGSK